MPDPRQAFETGEHGLNWHPFYQKHGQNLGREAYEASRETMGRFWGQDINDPDDMMELMQKVMPLLQRAIQLEAPHKEELEEAAKQITQQVWGLDPARMDAQLVTGQDIQPQGEIHGFADDEEEEEDEYPEFEGMELPEFDLDIDLGDDGSQGHIEHRVLMNLLTQGAAAHQYNTLHHLAAEVLEQIDPQLLQIYSRLASAITHTYWLYALEQMVEAAAGAAVGSEEIEWDEEDQGIVKARGICFPVLLHELTKGTMELITSAQISKLDPVQQSKVVEKADRFDYEALQLTIGPEVWRRFLAIVGDEFGGQNIAHVIAALSYAEPEAASDFVDAVVDNPDRAKELLSALMEQMEGDEDMQDPYEEHESWDTGEDDFGVSDEEWKGDVHDHWDRGDDVVLEADIHEILGMAPEAPVKDPKTKPNRPPTRQPRPGRPNPFKPSKPHTQPAPKFRDRSDDDMPPFHPPRKTPPSRGYGETDWNEFDFIDDVAANLCDICGCDEYGCACRN